MVEVSLWIPAEDFIEDYQRVREESSDFAAKYGAEFELTPEEHERFVEQYLREDTVNVEFLVFSERHTVMILPLNYIPCGRAAAWQEKRGGRLVFRDLSRD